MSSQPEYIEPAQGLLSERSPSYATTPPPFHNRGDIKGPYHHDTSYTQGTTSSGSNIPWEESHVLEDGSEKKRGRGGRSKRSKTKGVDEPKPVVRGTYLRMFEAFLTHSPALATTAVLLWISYVQIFWYTEQGRTASGGQVNPIYISNILQLAAKVHEIMIIFSTAAIMVSMYLRSLAGAGVRLGFVTGGYRLGDIWYFITGAFWKHFGGGRFTRWEGGLVAFLVLGTIHSVIVGPASAILLVPTLGWYPLPGAFSNIEMPLILETTAADSWPAVVGTNLFETQGECLSAESIFTFWCPPGGFSDIWSWAEGFTYSTLTNNLTFQHPSTQTRRRLEFTNTTSPTGDKVMLFTTTSNSMMTNIGLMVRYIASKVVNLGTISNSDRYMLESSTPMLQPYVQGACKVWDRDEMRAPGQKERVAYPLNALNCYGNKNCEGLKAQKFEVADFYWNDPADGNWRTFASMYVNDDSTRDPTTNLTTPATPQSVIFTTGLLPYRGGDDKRTQLSWIYACNFMASWVQSQVTLDPSVSDMIESNFSNADAMKKSYTEGQGVNKVLEVDPSYLKYLNPEFHADVTYAGVDDSLTNDTTSPILQLFNLFIKNTTNGLDGKDVIWVTDVGKGTKDDFEPFLTTLFGTYITDGLARTGANASTIVVLKDTPTELKLIDLRVQTGVDGGTRTITPLNPPESGSRVCQNNGEKEDECWETVFTLPEFRSEARAALQIDFSPKQYGYGSGQPSSTLTFALAVMYIYLGTVVVYGVVIVACHFLERILRKKSLHLKSVVAWADLQELFILALRTQPPADDDFAHVGAGVDAGRVWQKVIRARADEDEKMHLLLEERDGMVVPIKNHQYS